MGIFDVQDSEPIEIPFTIGVIINTIYKQYFFETILKFFDIKIDIEKEDDLQEQIKALTKTLQESELKAKLNIRFLEEKDFVQDRDRYVDGTKGKTCTEHVRFQDPIIFTHANV